MVKNGDKKYCKRGHPLFGDNVYRMRSGGRMCRACAAEWQRARRSKMRQNNLSSYITPIEPSS